MVLLEWNMFLHQDMPAFICIDTVMYVAYGTRPTPGIRPYARRRGCEYDHDPTLPDPKPEAEETRP